MAYAQQSSARPQRVEGPIRSLKRSFSTTTSSVNSSTSTSVTKAAIIQVQSKKLPASAYDFDLDDDDEDWSMGLDLDAPNASTSKAVSSAAIFETSTVSSATATTFTTKSSIAINALKSPPRAPPVPSNQMPLASQYHQPSILGLPKVPVTAKQSPPKIKNSTFRPMPTCENDAHKGKDRSGSDAKDIKGSKETLGHKLSSAALKAPFTAKMPSNQGSIANFIVKTDASSNSGKHSRASSTSSTTASVSAESGSKRKLPPWETSTSQSASSKAPKTSATNTSDSKGKRKATTSLNVKQQIVLSAEQQKVLKLVVEGGKNVFFTGSAGTGKSILLREIITSLKRKYEKRGHDRVAITASTGMAAANIGGTTIHSFAGIGLGQGTGEQLVDFVKKNRKAPGRWLRTEVLIIDEVSMLDGALFDKLAHIATRFRRKPGKPFGGIQLVMTGDFFQLPPVTKMGQPKFAFEADAWRECIDMTVNLTKVFRQRDTEFIDMLNEMRFGALSKDSIIKFGKLKRQPRYDDGLDPTELFPLREQVDSSNRARLAALPGETWTFTAIDEGEESGDKLQKILDNVMAPRVLTLKVDAQVMLLKNMENGLVNGSIGKVIGFTSAEEETTGTNHYVEDEGEEEFNIRERVKQSGDDEEDMKPSKKPKYVSEKTPVVLWKLPDGGTLRMRMTREEFKVDDVGDKVKAKRKQFPMICAWAMSIHKSQGQTLERVKCDLGKIFEKGQAYVALSRATSLDGLQVLNFKPEKVMAHPKVVAWTKTLTSLADQ